MTYGSESWAVIEIEKIKIKIPEMKMPRWICSVIRLNIIKN